ncbi:uncharacterized protein CIMG_13399 [Coccidioides immitis RS]|uniref:Uncharacterized protein n=1 Tax=Coccidioides immitis (strain RS) TaxID=246410 RepID=A0A0D8JV77_COCIM|nr:uncharacterized protein CIMG_13399 [Coccidioides immitis RS]KJF61059.1 hypothetical protein CIMG_13399 [Coccidioides immitis RS]
MPQYGVLEDRLALLLDPVQGPHVSNEKGLGGPAAWGACQPKGLKCPSDPWEKTAVSRHWGFTVGDSRWNVSCELGRVVMAVFPKDAMADDGWASAFAVSATTHRSAKAMDAVLRAISRCERRLDLHFDLIARNAPRARALGSPEADYPLAWFYISTTNKKGGMVTLSQ